MIKNSTANEKIDFVILWVDDNDQSWQDKKKIAEAQYGIKNDEPERYRDWNNLHYHFRAIEQNAPWVNHIYIVTDNQKPEWLKTEGNNVTIVDHQEIIGKKNLPTFNSTSIELNLHRIPGLSEKFVYFNDDMFIIDAVTPNDFFVDGVPRELAALNLIPPIKDNHISQVTYNNITLINDTFNKRKTLRSAPLKWLNVKHGVNIVRTLLLWIWPYFSGFKQTHLSSSFKKSTYQEIWEKYGEELEKSVSYQFRSPENFNQYLFRDWQLASNNFVPQSLKFGKVYQLDESLKTINKCATHIIRSKTKVICVNDTELLQNFEYAKKKINGAFTEVYPEKSRYEL